MKSFAFLLLLTLPTMAWSSGPLVESEIKGFELRQCSPDTKRCLHAKATLAQGSVFAPLYSMNDIEVTLEEKGKPTRAWKTSSAYMDFELNQLVVWPKGRPGKNETIFDLNEITSFETSK